MSRALDLFCKAGGATKGLQRAGFHVTGVDIEAQPHYCGDNFIQSDALVMNPRAIRRAYDFVWASPPCQAYAQAALSQRNSGKEYPALIPDTRELLVAIGLPYVIENVIDAPLLSAIMLCGSMFGLRTWRHRLFEVPWWKMRLLPPCNHTGLGICVVGHGTPSWIIAKNGGKCVPIAEMRAAMGIDWMNREELSQAIPPAYSEFIGRQFLEAQMSTKGEDSPGTGTSRDVARRNHE